MRKNNRTQFACNPPQSCSCASRAGFFYTKNNANASRAGFFLCKKAMRQRLSIHRPCHLFLVIKPRINEGHISYLLQSIFSFALRKMQLHQDINKLRGIKNPIVTIGTFDGVHAGHRVIIDRIKTIARERNGQSVLVTFEPHPRFLINPNHNLKLLTTLNEKKELLADLGLDHLIIAPFTKTFAEQEAAEYVEEFLIKKIKPQVLVIGYDHHFGKQRSGSFELLQEYAANHHFELEEISKQLVDDAHVSSTAIRRALENGDVTEANHLLQSNYKLSGTIIKGDQKGRTIGFPTANISIGTDKKLIPANGVYAVKAFVGKIAFDAVMNIGVRPTVNTENELRLEVHIFNFEQDVYGEQLCVEFIGRIRDEKKFASFEELKEQIEADCEKAQALLK